MIAARGMNPATGRSISGLDHIRMCVGQILTTPIGSCIERRDFGSRLADLIDAPLNARTRLLVIASSAAAIRRWEPRLRISRIDLSMPADQPGLLTIDIDAIVTGTEERVALAVPVRRAST